MSTYFIIIQTIGIYNNDLLPIESKRDPMEKIVLQVTIFCDKVIERKVHEIYRVSPSLKYEQHNIYLFTDKASDGLTIHEKNGRFLMILTKQLIERLSIRS